MTSSATSPTFEALARMAKPHKPEAVEVLFADPDPPPPVLPDSAATTPEDSVIAPLFRLEGRAHADPLEEDGMERKSYYSTGVNLEALKQNSETQPNRHLHDYHDARMKKFLKEMTRTPDMLQAQVDSRRQEEPGILPDRFQWKWWNL
mmetsp:Transcript_61576/g.115150  ORF Transcript_61576/g.115150 Transcript_61576/m.115150 type:complete len:148 (+) Transcript_61576:71-514(+)